MSIIITAPSRNRFFGMKSCAWRVTSVERAPAAPLRFFLRKDRCLLASQCILTATPQRDSPTQSCSLSSPASSLSMTTPFRHVRPFVTLDLLLQIFIPRLHGAVRQWPSFLRMIFRSRRRRHGSASHSPKTISTISHTTHSAFLQSLQSCNILISVRPPHNDARASAL